MKRKTDNQIQLRILELEKTIKEGLNLSVDYKHTLCRQVDELKWVLT